MPNLLVGICTDNGTKEEKMLYQIYWQGNIGNNSRKSSQISKEHLSETMSFCPSVLQRKEISMDLTAYFGNARNENVFPIDELVWLSRLDAKKN